MATCRELLNPALFRCCQTTNKCDLSQEKNFLNLPLDKSHFITGIAIKLNDELKPFLINLREHYTQYTLENVLAMKSVYAIRIYELLQSKIMSRVLPKDGANISIPINELKECCDCVDKYTEFSNFRMKVLDKAKSEINRVTMFKMDYSYIKKGRCVVGIEFHVNMRYH